MKTPQIAINQDLLQLIAEIDEFKGKWQALKNMSPKRLQRLRKVATIESIGSSTRIEGAKLSDIQVETLLSHINTTAFETRDEQEVAGYAEAMDLVFQAYEDFNVTENHICQLHQQLLRHSDKDERHRGHYKKMPNPVVAKDRDGHEIGVVFETATPFDTPQEMEALVKWTSKVINEKSMHPLLIIAIFTVEFLAIHPFQDGNGRLSHILTTLLLLRAGYDYVPYASLESVIEENKDIYYKALRRTQTTLKQDTQDWQPWFSFFFRCLKKQKDKLATKIKQEKITHDTELPLLSIKIIELLKQHQRLTTAQLVDMTDSNQNTLKVRLKELVDAKLIQRHGKARATWYSLMDN